VQVYTGVNKLGYIQPQTLARQDIVITSYETLRKEIDYVDLPHTKSQLLLLLYGCTLLSYTLQDLIVYYVVLSLGLQTLISKLLNIVKQ